MVEGVRAKRRTEETRGNWMRVMGALIKDSKPRALKKKLMRKPKLQRK